MVDLPSCFIVPEMASKTEAGQITFVSTRCLSECLLDT